MVRLTVCYIGVLALVTGMANAGWLTDPLDRLHQVRGGDKVLHFVLVGTLALLVNISVRGANVLSGQFAVVTATIFVAVLATCEELSNLLISGRNCSGGDLAANYLGILCIGVLPLAVSHRWPALRLGGRTRTPDAS